MRQAIGILLVMLGFIFMTQLFGQILMGAGVLLIAWSVFGE